ncbi:restriction endonuclease subunit S [Streptococcus lutetiensis]|uniref:restriction endonuclease subunit S n=1 Tax=Streptococcus lutetiensis TaxID=150055 RepID=UPI0031B64E01
MTNKVPNIRFKGFTDDWEQRKFGEMFARRMERNNGEFDNTKWISVARMYYQTPDKVTSNNIDTRTYVMRKGDIAFEGHSNSEFKYGRFVANDIGDGVISELFPIYKHIDKYDLNYWKYAIQLESLMQSKLVKCIEISYTSSNKLDKDSFLKEKIPVASLAEQQKIGEYFSNLDHLITLHQRKCEQTKELKKFMLKKMFPKKGEKNPEIRFSGFTDDWEQRKAGEIFKSVSDKGYTDLPVLSASQELGMILRDEIGIDIKYDESSIKNYKRVKPGQFVIHLRSFQGGFAWSDIEGITSPAYTILDYQEPEEHCSKFWKIVLTSPMFITRLETVTYGIRDGRSISFTDFSTLNLNVPSIAEQQKIGEYFSKLDNLITLHQRKCEQLKELKKFMLQNMFPKKG